MKTILFSVALILGFLTPLSSQDIYLPVSSTSETAKAEYFEALQAIENADIPGFFDGMKAAVKTDPNFFMAYVNLAFSETAFGQYEKAAAFIKPALAIDPADFNECERIHHQALQAWEKDPKADPAEYMEALTAAYPNTPEAYDLAGRSAKWISNDTKSSVGHTLRLLELRPDFGGGYNTLGYNYLALGEMDKAKVAFEKYIELAPREGNAYDSMADYFMANKEYARSVEYYDKAAAMGMSNATERADQARAAMKGNVAVIDGLYQGFAKGDVPAVLAAMDANIVWNEAEGFPYADQNPYKGPEAVLNGVFGRIMAEWEYWNLTDIQLHDMSGNMVLATLRYQAKHKTTGNVIDSQTAHLWTLWDGKITAFQQFTDTKQAAEAYNNDQPPAPAVRKSIHLFDLPADVTEAEWSAVLKDMNSTIAKMGYPGAGYFLYKTEKADTKDYRYYFEGVWPSAEAYTKIHEDPAFKALDEKYGPLYKKIQALEIYRRVGLVE